MKTCTLCGQTKPYDLFTVNPRVKDGFGSHCRECHNAKCRELRAANDAYRAKQKENARLRESTEAYKLRRKEYRVSSFVKRALDDEWAARNPWYKKSTRVWYKLKKEHRVPPWVRLKDVNPFYKEAHAKRMTVDHIIPLRGKNVSGLHTPENLQLLSLRDNMQKRDKYAP